MKAKEEYVDAPRETRSKDITVYAIIFLVLLVGAGIFFAVKLLHKPRRYGACKQQIRNCLRLQRCRGRLGQSQPGRNCGKTERKGCGRHDQYFDEHRAVL